MRSLGDSIVVRGIPMWKSSRLIIVFFVLVIVLIGLAHTVSVPTSNEAYQLCLDQATVNHLPLDGCPKSETIWTRGLRDPLAFYTLCLTIVTLALAIGALGQSALIEHQIRLSRQEFVATHRPKMIVHSVEFLTINSPSEALIGADITIFNIGDTQAEDIVVSGMIIDDAGRPEAGLEFPIIETRQASIPGTQSKISVSVASETSALVHDVGLVVSRNEGEKEYITNLRCIGTIAYSDSNRVRRVTGFCWRLKDKRWVRQSKSAYEYAY